MWRAAGNRNSVPPSGCGWTRMRDGAAATGGAGGGRTLPGDDLGDALRVAAGGLEDGDVEMCVEVDAGKVGAHLETPEDVVVAGEWIAGPGVEGDREAHRQRDPVRSATCGRPGNPLLLRPQDALVGRAVLAGAGRVAPDAHEAGQEARASGERETRVERSGELAPEHPRHAGHLEARFPKPPPVERGAHGPDQQADPDQREQRAKPRGVVSRLDLARQGEAERQRDAVPDQREGPGGDDPRAGRRAQPTVGPDLVPEPGRIGVPRLAGFDLPIQAAASAPEGEHAERDAHEEQAEQRQHRAFARLACHPLFETRIRSEQAEAEEGHAEDCE